MCFDLYVVVGTPALPRCPQICSLKEGKSHRHLRQDPKAHESRIEGGRRGAKDVNRRRRCAGQREGLSCAPPRQGMLSIE